MELGRLVNGLAFQSLLLEAMHWFLIPSCYY